MRSLHNIFTLYKYREIFSSLPGLNITLADIQEAIFSLFWLLSLPLSENYELYKSSVLHTVPHLLDLLDDLWQQPWTQLGGPYVIPYLCQQMAGSFSCNLTDIQISKYDRIVVHLWILQLQSTRRTNYLVQSLCIKLLKIHKGRNRTISLDSFQSSYVVRSFPPNYNWS
jgi:hypothetical protein